MTLFVLAAMGCTGDVNESDSDTSVGVDPDDTSDPSNYGDVMVVMHASLNGATIITNPPPVCIHRAEGEVGSEDTLATGSTTEVETPVNVYSGGEMVRPWIGPKGAPTTSDGYRIYERDGFSYIHVLADFLLGTDVCGENETAKMPEGGGCEVTVPLNVMPALEDTAYACVGQQWWTESGKELSNSPHDFTQKFVASEGQYFADPDEMGFDELLGTNESLMTKGTELWIHNTTIGDYEVDEGTEVTETGFTLVYDNGDFTTHLTCTIK